jgi:hypothetical protein
MALSKNISVLAFGQEVQIPNAYIKVSSVNGTKSEVFCTVTTHTQDQDKFVKTQIYSFAPNMNGSNFIAQSYQHLKTLEEFAGAVDC